MRGLLVCAIIDTKTAALARLILEQAIDRVEGGLCGIWRVGQRMRGAVELE
jgi:hypothetical protein